MRASLRTLPPPDSLSRQPSPTVISLGQARSRPRATNDYVDSPRALPSAPLKAQHITQLAGGGGSPGFTHRVVAPSRPGVTLGGGGGNLGGGSPRLTSVTLSSSPVISVQPLSKPSPLKKDSYIDGDSTSDGAGGGGIRDGTNLGSSSCASDGNGIMCETCGKCQCKACLEPKQLPSQWCCKDKCEVSPDKCLDVCTCFCCVKCTFYHCGAGEEENECYERPCGCRATPHCCQRWTVISLVSLCLPCLWCYWPARGCLAACRFCYNCPRRRKGCQCHVRQSAGSKTVGLSSGVGGVGVAGGPAGLKLGSAASKHSQTRRLLIESDSSSA